MHVVIVGCGRVGIELAGALEAAGHSVSVIDKNRRSFRNLPSNFAGSTFVGLGFDRDILVEAGIERAEALAAVTNGDNSNILTVRIARETFGIEHVAARIYDPRRAVLYQRLGIATVATVAWATEQILRRLLPSEAHPEWVDPTGQIKLVEVALPDAWAGEPLDRLDEPGRFWLVGLTRLGQAQLTTYGLAGQDGDIVHIMVAADAMDELDARLEKVGEGDPRV
ncbi:MAG: TrkA family potassium uptake protein [Acidimicrobiia bacterium]|nr:TrkA family potassium uptake protein [Acidimicrobiia bacterium]